jgi:hypothetical protein
VAVALTLVSCVRVMSAADLHNRFSLINDAFQINDDFISMPCASTPPNWLGHFDALRIETPKPVFVFFSNSFFLVFVCSDSAFFVIGF